jgi:hypothetical protein
MVNNNVAMKAIALTIAKKTKAISKEVSLAI